MLLARKALVRQMASSADFESLKLLENLFERCDAVSSAWSHAGHCRLKDNCLTSNIKA